MKHLLLAPLILSLGLPVQGEVSTKTHKMCLKANDYLGCVKAQTTSLGAKKTVSNSGTTTKKGNSCPTGYAYIGNGYCREVTCQRWETSSVLVGKKWTCDQMKNRKALSFGETLQVDNDPNCSKGEPKIGWQSTCDAPYEEAQEKEKILGKLKNKNYRSAGGGGGGGGVIYRSSGTQPQNHLNWQPNNNTSKPFSSYQNKYNNQIKTTNPYGNYQHKSWGNIP